MRKLIRPQWNEDEGPAANARRALPVLVNEYFALVRKVISDPNASPRKLHRVRLATKQLRYSLELFRSCYGPGLETRLGGLRDLQQLLGDIADCSASERTVTKFVRSHSARAPVTSFLRTRSDSKIAAFRKYWADTFDAEGRERWWTTYLERNARAARPPIRR